MAEQTTFLKDEVLGINTDSLKLEEHSLLNASSAKVLVTLLRTHPEIAQISYTTFDPNFASSVFTPLESPTTWVSAQRMTVHSLQTLSDSIRRKGEETYIENENGEFIKEKLPLAMAVHSEIRLSDGSYMHIPMLDFESYPFIKNDPATAVRLLHTLQEPGALLETDHSFHFIGFQLMTPDRWNFFMKQLRNESKTEYNSSNNKVSYRSQTVYELFDQNFLDSSLERGYAALRLFGYKGTEKKRQPRVITII